MPTFSIENFGCRATDADAAALRRSLLASGLSLLDDHQQADFVILNSCTVTAAADSQARDAVRKIHRTNPDARIVVTGCYAQRAPEEIASLDGVAWVVGNSHQSEIARLLRNFQPGLFAGSQRQTLPATADFVALSELNTDAMSLERGPAKILTGDIFAQTSIRAAPQDGVAGDRTRPILKIQDGCNNRCSYCVIPFVRGRSRSLAPDFVVEEVRKLVRAGAKEIVLSGINLGAYGRDFTPRTALVDVVRRVLDETTLDQLRFSSVEPQDATEDFVNLVVSSHRIARHFHIPLQSGSARVLKAMHRWYRPELYAERVNRIRRGLPDAAIGADVIVGFPGETDDDYRATYNFIDALPLTYLHVFSFSSRPGTKAAEFDASPVASPVIRDRARALRALSQRKAAEFRESQSGRRLRAITLARGGTDWTEALTSNYLKVRIRGRHPANRWSEAEVLSDETAIGGGQPADVELALENNFSEGQIPAMGDR
ncbi:MAG TPA: tRNA (N(6)-L-threonylcarbamoyladenosine(37)-C(2))-methylthiotransferase MtaB [Candidatus Acidoferrales bacterium]